MNRPHPIPPALLTAIDTAADSYAGRQRLKISFASWANREGPATKCPSAPMTRDIRAIAEFPERVPVAAVLDALQTLAVTVAIADQAEGLPDLVGTVKAVERAISNNGWHP